MTVPTEPGLYWFKNTFDKEWMTLRVFERGGELHASTFAGLATAPIQRWNGEWGGPAPSGPEDGYHITAEMLADLRDTRQKTGTCPLAGHATIDPCPVCKETDDDE